jgi:uncharacterized protein (TIGR03435 family)
MRPLCLQLALVVLVGQLLPTPLAQAQNTQQAAQTAEKPLDFDVVSVKQNFSNDLWSFSAPGDGLSYHNYPLFYLVIYSNDYHRPDSVFGLPQWTRTTNYDVVAKVAQTDLAKYHSLTKEERGAMFQRVLADRFKLSFHKEMREMPVYELIVAKSGLKMKESDPSATSELKTKYGQNILFVSSGELWSEGGKIGDLALMLSTGKVDRQVVDRTGLHGTYDFKLRFAPAPTTSSETDSQPSVDSEPDIQDALLQQLGLELRPAKAPIECFVVDHIEKPSPN